MVSSTMLRVAVVSALVLLSGAVKMGGHVQDKYVSAFKLYADWANKAKAGSVVTSFKTFNSTTMAADVAKMTTSGDATYVDVLICPYGSADVIKCVGAVNKSYKGPVIAWGGASDTIFDTTCAALTNKNCFGFFTVGSDYAKSGLVAVDAKISATAQVALIVNDNGFSRSVAVGVRAHTVAQAGLALQSDTTISVSKKALTDADKAKVKAAMDKKPDIVVIAGHNKDVEPTIIAIGKAVAASQNFPHAIIATNGISATTNYGADAKYAQCVMMPTQWDSSTAAKDTVVGWDSAAFTTAMGGSASYQQASAGAVGVAIANALKTQPDKTKLVATLQAMDVNSFYGKLKWDAKGRIQKPMYTQQLQMAAKTVVAPTGTANMKFPLGIKSCWNFTAPPATTGATSNSNCSENPSGCGSGNTSGGTKAATPTATPAATPVATPTLLTGSMNLKVPNATAFLKDMVAQQAVKDGIAALLSGISSSWIALVVTAARRLEGFVAIDDGRRLNATALGAVKVAYTITIPANATTTATAHAKKLGGLTVAALTTSIKGKLGAGYEAMSVTSKTEVVESKPAKKGTTAAPNTETSGAVGMFIFGPAAFLVVAALRHVN